MKIALIFPRANPQHGTCVNKHPTTLMLSLIGLFLVVIGLTQLHRVWKHVLLAAIVIGAITGWVVYFNLLLQSLW